MNILEIKNLSKSFGKLKVINNLNLKVANNTVFGFLGKNGAGKTTTMKMVMGLLKADRGNILVSSKEVRFGQTAVNKDIGYLPEVVDFYGYMTPKEYLMLSGQISGLKSGEVNQRAKDLLAIVGLEGVNRRIQGFSRGMKQRFGIAQALLHQPKLLLCDEPTSALDPVGTLGRLSINYFQINDYQTAANYFEEANKICVTNQDCYLDSRILMSMTKIYLANQQKQKARELYNTFRKIKKCKKNRDVEQLLY